MDVVALAPPLLTQEEEGGGGVSPSWVLLDEYAYISADSVFNSTTAVGHMSTGKSIHFSFCLGRPPLLSYLCAHFPGPVFSPTVGTVFGPPASTPAVRCVEVPPVVLSTHADLALIRVTIPGAPDINNDSAFDYFVYKAHPRPGASSLDLLPRPTGAPRFRDNDVAIVRCSGGDGSRYVIAALRTTINRLQFILQLYDSNTGSWTMTPLSLHQPERDRVLPIPDSATEQVFHNTNKVVVLGSTTVGWVDLWRGILFCDVLDKNPVLRDMPLPKPARRNKRGFCVGGPIGQRDIAVVTIAKEEAAKIMYVVMEFRPGVVPSPQPLQPMDSGSSSDGEDNIQVAPYWMATVWSMPLPITSWNDWHKDCAIDVADTIVQNPSHCKVLLALPTRLSTDPEDDAAVSFRRLCTGYPTLGLGMDGDLAIYFLSKVDDCSPEGWVIQVGIKDNNLHGIAKLDDWKNRSFRRYFCITDISKHLTRATGTAGALVLSKYRKK